MNSQRLDKRNDLIDSLRTLGAMAVCLFHFNEPFHAGHTYYGKIVKYGWLGVPVFFVISGYCMLLSVNENTSFSNFSIRRLFRIFPVYWFSLIVVLCVATGHKILTGTNAVTSFPTSAAALLATFTLTTSPFSNIPTINWTYWSLSYELSFYAIVALSLFIPSKYRIFGFMLISILSLLIPSETAHPSFFLQHWPAFALGLSIRHHHTCQQTNIYLIITAVLINISALFFGMAASALPGIYKSAVAGTVVLIFFSPYLKMRQNLISRMADYTYGIYLIHVPIGVFIFCYIKGEIIINNSFYNCLFDLILFLLISSIAHFIFRYVEQPFIMKGKQLAEFRPKPTSATS